MRASLRATAIAVALTASGCDQPVDTPNEAKTNELELGKIEAQARDANDNTVTVELHWTFRRQASFPMSVAELPPVFLFNEQFDLRAGPEGGLPDWHNDEVHFEATLSVPTEAWRQGCWQARYRIVGVVENMPITCLNQGV